MSLLTDQEHYAVRVASELAALLREIVGHDQTRSADLAELIAPLHTIQRAVLSNAAARAYPGRYRPLGEVLEVPR